MVAFDLMQIERRGGTAGDFLVLSILIVNMISRLLTLQKKLYYMNIL